MDDLLVLRLDGTRSNTIETLLTRLIRRIEVMSDSLQSKLDRLTQEVAENKDATASATALIANISQMLTDARNSAASQGATDAQLAQLDAAIQDLDEHDTTLAGAVTRNTPAAPAAGGGEAAPVDPSVDPAA